MIVPTYYTLSEVTFNFNRVTDLPPNTTSTITPEPIITKLVSHDLTKLEAPPVNHCSSLAQTRPRRLAAKKLRCSTSIWTKSNTPSPQPPSPTPMATPTTTTTTTRSSSKRNNTPKDGAPPVDTQAQLQTQTQTQPQPQPQSQPQPLDVEVQNRKRKVNDDNSISNLKSQRSRRTTRPDIPPLDADKEAVPPETEKPKYLVEWECRDFPPEVVELSAKDETKDVTVEDRWHRLYPPYLSQGTHISVFKGGQFQSATILRHMRPEKTPKYEVRWDSTQNTDLVTLTAEGEDCEVENIGWKRLSPKPPLKRGDRVSVLYDEVTYYQGRILYCLPSGPARQNARVPAVEPTSVATNTTTTSPTTTTDRNKKSKKSSSHSSGKKGTIVKQEDIPQDMNKPSLINERPLWSPIQEDINDSSLLPLLPDFSDIVPVDSSSIHSSLYSPLSLLSFSLSETNYLNPLLLGPSDFQCFSPTTSLGEATDSSSSLDLSTPATVLDIGQDIFNKVDKVDIRGMVTESEMGLQMNYKVSDGMILKPDERYLEQLKKTDVAISEKEGRVIQKPEKMDDIKSDSKNDSVSIIPAEGLPRALCVLEVKDENPALQEMALRILETEFDEILPRLLKGIVCKNNFGTRTMLALWGEEPVGAAAVKWHQIKQSFIMEIVLFTIGSPYRGKGFGTLMATVLYEMASNTGCQKVVLRAAPKAHAFWSLMGFINYLPNPLEKEVVLHNNVEFDAQCAFMQRSFLCEGSTMRRTIITQNLQRYSSHIDRLEDNITNTVWSINNTN